MYLEDKIIKKKLGLKNEFNPKKKGAYFYPSSVMINESGIFITHAGKVLWTRNGVRSGDSHNFSLGCSVFDRHRRLRRGIGMQCVACVSVERGTQGLPTKGQRTRPRHKILFDSILFNTQGLYFTSWLPIQMISTIFFCNLTYESTCFKHIRIIFIMKSKK